MPERVRTRLRVLAGDVDEWMRQRRAEVSRHQRQLDRAGRTVWNHATRAGLDRVARTPEELRALGKMVLGDRSGTAASTSTRTPPRPAAAQGAKIKPKPAAGAKPAKPDRLREVALQVDTATRAAANVLTLGGADHFAAGMDALFEPGGISGWEQRYRANLTEELARNRYDQDRRAAANAAGSIAGTILGIRAMGPGAATTITRRLTGAAPISVRDAATVVGLGGATGLAAQGLADIADGGRRSSWGDNVGAAAGGMAGAAALPLGGPRAAAVGGWVTSTTQDALNRRPVSFGQAARAAAAGHLLGSVGGRLGTRWADALPPIEKGRLGELLGSMRSTVNGMRRELSPKMADRPVGKSPWYPDGRHGAVRFEDKFGYQAALSGSQRAAQEELGENFILYHFTPDDIGRAAGMLTSAWAPHVMRRSEAALRDRPRGPLQSRMAAQDKRSPAAR